MYLGDAALSYKKVNPEEALKLWQTSGDLLVDTAKFARAAKTFQVRLVNHVICDTNFHFNRSPPPLLCGQTFAN